MKTKLGNESKNENSQLINWYPALKRYCRTITRSHWDGDDLAQETMIKMLNNYINRESTDQNVSLALMYRIAQNHWIDQIRKGSKESKASFSEPAYEPMKSFPEVFATIEKLVMNLTPQQTVIFLLKDVFQFSLLEIASHLTLSEGAVKATLFRTRNRLKTIMVEDDNLNPFYGTDDEDGTTDLLFTTIIDAIRDENPKMLIEITQRMRTEKVKTSHISPSCSAGITFQLRAA